MLTWLDINLDHISYNVRAIRDVLEADVKIVAVIKSNAYGHGLVEVARTVWAAGAEVLGVSSVDEGVSLRLAKIRAPILVMGYTEPSNYQYALEHSLELTLFNREDIKALARAAASAHSPARVHLKVDTGMHRLGVNPGDVAEMAEEIRQEPYLMLEAIFSHFADASDRAYSKGQIKALQSALFFIQQEDISLPSVHMANSSAIVLHPESQFDMVRPGAAIYGITDDIPKLKPALAWRTKVAQIKRVPANQRVGYGLIHKLKRISLLAVVPVGYADGYPRTLSNKGKVLLGGQRLPVVGRVCMNQTIVDATGVGAKVGDEVVLIGPSGNDTIKAQELADWAGTNPHEIVARLPSTLPRNFLRKEQSASE